MWDEQSRDTSRIVSRRIDEGREAKTGDDRLFWNLLMGLLLSKDHTRSPLFLSGSRSWGTFSSSIRQTSMQVPHTTSSATRAKAVLRLERSSEEISRVLCESEQ